jgi:hypothetical protein
VKGTEIPVPDRDLTRQREVVDAFFSAARGGDFDALVAVLDPGVVLRIDAGARRPAASMAIRGAAAVAGQRLMSGFEWWLLRSSEIPTTPFLDGRDFAWAGVLEDGWREIRAELEEVLARREDLPNFQDILRDVAPISRDDRLKTFFFLAYGYRAQANCEALGAVARHLGISPQTAKTYLKRIKAKYHQAGLPVYTKLDLAEHVRADCAAAACCPPKRKHRAKSSQQPPT